MDKATIIAALITSVVTGVIGIWQIILTRKSLENSNRPYITIFSEVINIVNPLEFIVIKNSGNMPARITDIIYDEAKLYLMNCELPDRNHENALTMIRSNNIMSYFKNSTIAPNQSYRIPINNLNTKFEDIAFTITYKGLNSKKYKETQLINLKQNLEIVPIKSNGETAVEDVLQEILKRM